MRVISGCDRRFCIGQGDPPVTCVNCGEEDYPVDQYHVHLSTDQVIELELCEGCRHKFVTADWVEFVV